MLTLTPEILDRIEAVRDNVTAAITSSELPTELTIELRQAMNTTIDRTVQMVLDRASAAPATSPTINSSLQF